VLHTSPPPPVRNHVVERRDAQQEGKEEKGS